MGSLLCCPHCNLVHYCSSDCLEEHWVKVHNKHCSSLAASVVPTTYLHKEEECDQCLAVAAQGGPEAVADQQSPLYPCTEMQKAPNNCVNYFNSVSPSHHNLKNYQKY